MSGLIQGTGGIVMRLQRLPIFIHCTVALAGNIKDLTDLYVAPYHSPRRLIVAAERVPVSVDRSLIIVLLKEQLSNAKARQRTLRINLECCLIISQRRRRIALCGSLLPPQNIH